MGLWNDPKKGEGILERCLSWILDFRVEGDLQKTEMHTSAVDKMNTKIPRFS